MLAHQIIYNRCINTLLEHVNLTLKVGGKKRGLTGYQTALLKQWHGDKMNHDIQELINKQFRINKVKLNCLSFPKTVSVTMECRNENEDRPTGSLCTDSTMHIHQGRQFCSDSGGIAILCCYNGQLNNTYISLSKKIKIKIKTKKKYIYIYNLFQLTARDLLYAPSSREKKTYHGICYTSCGALAGMKNGSMSPK